MLASFSRWAVWRLSWVKRRIIPPPRCSWYSWFTLKPFWVVSIHGWKCYGKHHYLYFYTPERKTYILTNECTTMDAPRPPSKYAQVKINWKIIENSATTVLEKFIWATKEKSITTTIAMGNVHFLLNISKIYPLKSVSSKRGPKKKKVKNEKK